MTDWPDWSTKYDETSLVYFITSESATHVKIGTTGDLERRLAQLQTSHFERLRVVCTLPGGPEEEGYYHRLFSEHRGVGEWFRNEGSLREFLTRMEGINNDLDT